MPYRLFYTTFLAAALALHAWSPIGAQSADPEEAPTNATPPNETDAPEPFLDFMPFQEPLPDSGQLLDRVVAWLDNDPLMLSEVEETLVRAQANGAIADGPPTEMRLREALDLHINEELMLREARENGIQVVPERVDKRVEEILANVEREQGGPEVFNAFLQRTGLTRQTLRERLRKQVRREWTIAQAVTSRITVTEDEVREFVAQREEAGQPTERYALAHLFIPVEATASDLSWRETIEAAYEMRLAAVRGGSFLDAAAEWAERYQGEAGELGSLTPDELQPALAAALKDIPEGESTEPIRTGRGVHVLYLQRHTTPRAILFARRYAAEKQSWAEELRRETDIQTAPVLTPDQ